MRRLAIVVALLVFGLDGCLPRPVAAPLPARSPPIRATPLAAGVTIQAKEMVRQESLTAVAGKAGQFRLANLPAGTYEISVPQIRTCERRAAAQAERGRRSGGRRCRSTSR